MPQRSIDNRIDFLSPVEIIPGLGPKRAEALRESGIETIGDLLHHLPLRYIDRSVITPLRQISSFLDKTCTVVGEVTRTRVERGRRSRFRIEVRDATGTVEALWFRGVQMYRHQLRTGMRVLLTGKVSSFGKLQIVHPLVETMGANQESPEAPFKPVYSLTEAMREAGVRQKVLFKAISWALNTVKHFPQVLPSELETRRGYPPLSECLRRLHAPDDPNRLSLYRERLKCEELYRLGVTLALSKRKFQKQGRSLAPGELPQKLRHALSFSLTSEQDAAVETLLRDCAENKRMHRLLQGDVGSGKTVVAFFCCLPSLNEGYQVAWLAPTEILAQQTYCRIKEWASALGFRSELLVGGMCSADKLKVLDEIAAGSVSCIVGTHALLQPSVSFLHLGIVVVDEQHRFGVRQRLSMQEKDPHADFLLLSATPIPRTLSQTLYGDLDITTITSRPAGPVSVKTHLVPESKRADMERFIVREIQSKTVQAFYIVPRIESEEEEGVKNVIDVFSALSESSFSSLTCGIVHGRVQSAEREDTMARFASGELQVLFATSVVEVGVDIPAATIIVIENAERFGLSQLHQLRGRVGRRDRNSESYCFLMADTPPGSQAEQRLRFFCRTRDGFEIAEKDLQLRGPGERIGLRQSGWPDDIRFTDPILDNELYRDVQQSIDLLQLPE